MLHTSKTAKIAHRDSSIFNGLNGGWAGPNAGLELLVDRGVSQQRYR
jgi:hypothetical protein